ncbi:hypothetical protein [Pseudomonas sp. PDM32]|jgi:hypothetical protein|nr:hypothetical protein [Pseudomonas sp. PDM32]
MRKPLIIIRIYLLSRALAAFWKRSRRLPVEAIIGFSRRSGRS